MKRFRVGEEGESDSISMANVLMLLSRGAGDGEEVDHVGPQHPGRVFECKTCNRQFPSFQALGGHRASHKKPRLMGDQNGPTQQAALSKPRVHECSICGLEFAVGQALGGHMRRHRSTTEGLPLALMEKKTGGGGGGGGGAGVGGGAGEKRSALSLDLDLNVPPSDNDMDFRLLRFDLGLPMVDCLH